jgi:hypothetical protein
MSFRLRTMLLGQAVGPPVLAWMWSNRAELGIALPLLAYIPALALAAALLVLWHQDERL